MNCELSASLKRSNKLNGLN